MDIKKTSLAEANEMLRPLRSTFKQRYSEWSLSDTLDQSRRGFPLLKKVRSSTALRALSHLNTLGEIQREKLLRAAWANKHLEPKAQSLSGEEIALFDSLRQAILIPSTSEDINQSLVEEHRRFKINKKTLRAEVNRFLEPLLGTPERLGPQEWQFQTSIGGWAAYTLIDIGGKSQLRYEHRVGLRDHVFLEEHIDLQSWMGFGHTKWNQIRESEIAEAARDLTEICRHFLATLPNLLEGLVPPWSLTG